MKQVSGKKLIAILQKHGWKVARSRGSHFSLKKPGEKNIITVSAHGNRPLKSGLLTKYLKDAGLTIDDI